MLEFTNDYQNVAHPAVLRALVAANDEALPGYGDDSYCAAAEEKIRAACECPQAKVKFITGGTMANTVIEDMMIKSYQGIICAQTGHINLHEAGSLEFTGHKVLTIPPKDGKLEAAALKSTLETLYSDGNREHMILPGIVYITHPTEYGTLYTLQELKELSEVCHAYNLPLYLDGARLGYALASRHTDVTLPDIAKYCDVFYIGGTKCGAAFGEAVVFTKNNLPEHFLTMQKQHCALLAKGFVMGVQFDALFTDHLYVNICRHAIDCAERMKEIIREKGVPFLIDSPTNQQFVIMENSKLNELAKHVNFSFWEKVDDTHTAIRFVTNWKTDMQQIEELALYL